MGRTSVQYREILSLDSHTPEDYDKLHPDPDMLFGLGTSVFVSVSRSSIPSLIHVSRYVLQWQSPSCRPQPNIVISISSSAVAQNGSGKEGNFSVLLTRMADKVTRMNNTRHESATLPRTDRAVTFVHVHQDIPCCHAASVWL